jgi:hypothetical protein
MIHFAIAAMHLLATTSPVGEPRVSADVVTARFEGLSLADGLESCLITVKMRKGWYIFANPSGNELAQADSKAGVKRDPKRSVVFTIALDSKPRRCTRNERTRTKRRSPSGYSGRRRRTPSG